MTAYEANHDSERPLDIELVPQVWKADLTERLSQSIRHCSALRAAIAFWTIDRELLNQRLTEGLKYAPVIRRCLAYDADARYSTAAEFARELDALAHSS